MQAVDKNVTESGGRDRTVFPTSNSTVPTVRYTAVPMSDYITELMVLNSLWFLG